MNIGNQVENGKAMFVAGNVKVGFVLKLNYNDKDVLVCYNDKKKRITTVLHPKSRRTRGLTLTSQF